ncbi:MAG: hypothetical protein M0C28_27535 [Candidatus Moduliflexus flocculans]|nr:hypothetical protein [Candidatus Moduliflexus flocculans]
MILDYEYARVPFPSNPRWTIVPEALTPDSLPSKLGRVRCYRGSRKTSMSPISCRPAASRRSWACDRTRSSSPCGRPPTRPITTIPRAMSCSTSSWPGFAGRRASRPSSCPATPIRSST